MAGTYKKSFLMWLLVFVIGAGLCGLAPSRALSQGAGTVTDQKPAPADPSAGPSPYELSADCRTTGKPVDQLAPLPNTTRAIKQRKNVRLLAIGATSVARRDRADGGYDLLMETLLEKTVKGLTVDVIERGVSGELAEDAAERLKVEVALNRPDLVLWQVGTNDAMAYIPVARIERSISHTVQWLKANNVDVILIGLHYARSLRRDRHYQQTRAMLSKLSRSLKVMRIGRYEAAEFAHRAARAKLSTSFDEVEQTEQSYDCMAEHIARGITTILFTKQSKVPPPR